MYITPINSTNSQPNFKGYVDPKLINLIKKSANAAIKNNFYDNSFPTILKLEKDKAMQEISKDADKILEILENSGVKYLHPDTHITYVHNKHLKEVDIVLTNPKIKSSYWFGTLHNLYDERKFTPDNFNNKKLAELFNSFKSIFLGHYTYKPESLRMKEIEMFTKFTDGIALFRHKKANKLAPEFGLPSNWTKVLEKKRLKQERVKAADAIIAETCQKAYNKRMMENFEKYLK